MLPTLCEIHRLKKTRSALDGSSALPHVLPILRLTSSC